MVGCKEQPPNPPSRVSHAFSANDGLAAGRSRMAGPAVAPPSAANSDPWHGHTQHRSSAFHVTMQPMCGQIADRM
jgi:hypothetical protein